MENFAADDTQHQPTHLGVEYGILLTGVHEEGGIGTRILKGVFPNHEVAEPTRKQERSG